MMLGLRLRHSFGAFTLDVAFSAPEGVTALFGRSGAGKSTVVNALAGLLRPDQGRVSIGETVLLDTELGVMVPPHRRRVGYVFQDGRLFPHLSVRQNLSFGRWFAPRGPGRVPVAKVVDLLGIGNLLDRRPASLSGGEKQRVAIGRALLSAPQMLLMDEPLAALDDPRKAEILPYLERLRDETRVPIIYVSHSVSEVARLATSVVVLEDGRLVRAGPAEEILSDPRAVPLLGIREAGAILSARVLGHDPDDDLTELEISAARLWLPRMSAEPGQRVRLRIGANDVTIATERPTGIGASNVLAVTVSDIRTGGGPGAAVGLRVGGDHIVARMTRRSVEALGLAPGMACYAIIKATSIARRDVGGP